MEGEKVFALFGRKVLFVYDSLTSCGCVRVQTVGYVSFGKDYWSSLERVKAILCCWSSGSL